MTSKPHEFVLRYVEGIAFIGRRSTVRFWRLGHSRALWGGDGEGQTVFWGARDAIEGVDP